MKNILSLSAALALMTVATPALAQNRSVVVMTPGSSSNWVQQQPTAFLTTEQAQVLPDGLGYISAGGNVGTLPAGTLNYRRGMGNKGELAVGAGLNLNVGGAQVFAGGLNLGWKQQLFGGPSMAAAVNGGLIVGGLGGPATAVGLQLGVPLTFDVGAGHFTADPRITFPTLVGGASTTAGSMLGVSLGLNTPIANNWSFLGEVVPTVGLGGGGLMLPIGLGARFSPTATSHIDITAGQLNVTPGFTAGLGLLGITAHVGF